MSTLLLNRYMPIISDSARQGTTFDLLSLNFAYGLDFVIAFFFGVSRSTNFIQNVEARNQWLATYLESHPGDLSFWSLEIPNVTKWLAKIGIRIMPEWHLEARRDLDAWTLEMVDGAEEAITKQPAKDMLPGDYPVAYNQLRQALIAEQRSKDDGNRTAQRLELASECLDHIRIFLSYLNINSKLMYEYRC